MAFALNINYIANAITNAIENKIGKQELDLYEAIIFDDLKVHTPGGIRRVQNNLDNYYNHVVGLQESFMSNTFVLPYNINFSDKRHLLNHLTHVEVRVPNDLLGLPVFAPVQALPDTTRDRFIYNTTQYYSTTTNKPLTSDRYHQNNIIPERLVFADSFITEEALRGFSREYLAYDLLSTFLFRLEAAMSMHMFGVSSFFGGLTPFFPQISPPYANYKDLIETFFLYHSYHKFDKDSYFCAVFLNINEFRRFMLLKSNDGEYLICNNCMLNDVIEYNQAKIFAVPNAADAFTYPSQMLLCWVNTHVYFLTSGKLYLTYRHDYETNRHNFILEIMYAISPSILFLDNFGQVGYTSSISGVSLGTVSAV